MSPEAPRAHEVKPLIESQGVEADSGFLDEVFGSRQEQTIAGCVIGKVRGVFFEPDSAQAQAERAQSNDQIAMIAADTIASIPKLKAVTGGLVRATMLVNPHDSLGGNAVLFGTNALEGAALNKVSKLAMPESAFAKSLTVRLGSGLTAETATHLTVGFGFGAVKTSFNPDTWRGGVSAQGLLEGTGQVLKGGSVGALINVPAGMIGVRTAKASTTLLSREIVSPHVANMISGAGSGYAAGSVFGGVDAVMHGKSLPDVLSQMNQSGLIGAASGGLTASIIGTPKGHDKLRLKTPLVPETPGNAANTPKWSEISSQSGGPAMRSITLGIGKNGNRSLIVSDDGAAFEAMPSDTRRKGYIPESDNDAGGTKWKDGERKGMRRTDTTKRRPDEPELTPEERNDLIDDYWFNKVNYEPKETPLAELTKRLSKPSKGEETYVYTLENAPKTFKSREEFFQNTFTGTRPVRVYEVEGHTTKIVVPEEFAQQLDQARRQRMAAAEMGKKAETQCRYDDLPREKRQEIQAAIEKGELDVARKALGGDAEADRSIGIVKLRLAYFKIPTAVKAAVLPEDFIPLLDELPNSGLVKQLSLVGERNYEDAWHSATYEEGFTSAATASETGHIKFYKPKPGYLREFLLHEWSHLVKFNQKENSRLFDLAMIVDKEGMNMTHPPRKKDGTYPEGELAPGMFFASRYSRRNEHENFAVHMGEYMLVPDGDEFILLSRNAPVRVAMFGKTLKHEMNAAGKPSPFAEQFKQRVAYIDDVVVPHAQKVLQEYLWHPDPNKRAAAADLLGHIGNDSHVPILKSVAADESNAVATNIKTTDMKRSEIGVGSKTRFRGVEKTVSEAAFDAMVLLHDPKTRFEYLMEHATPGSTVKELAIDAMRGSQDRRAHMYANFYELAGNPASLPQIIEMIPKMPDVQGARLALNESLRLAKQSGEYNAFEASLALRLLDRRPDLQHEALQILIKHAPELDAKALTKIGRYARVQDKTTSDLAKRVLLLNENSHGTGIPGEVSDATWTLYKQRDFDSIVPLLDAAVMHGNAEAYEALATFARPVIKHYSRDIVMNRSTAVQGRRLEGLLKGLPFPG